MASAINKPRSRAGMLGIGRAASVLSLGALGALASCTRGDPPRGPGGGRAAPESDVASSSSVASTASGTRDAATAAADLGAAPPGDAAVDAPAAGAEALPIDGPHEDLRLDAGRPIFYASRAGAPRPLRLVGHLHGMCGPPSYACGKWLAAGTEVGLMVCPTGNARCGESPMGPPSWDSPQGWLDLVAIMDRDLEAAIAKVAAKHRGILDREGAILTGYSRGAYAAPAIARRNPGRWPYLVLIEANVPLSAAALRAAGVRAVALVAGEQGTEIAGEQKSERELGEAGFPAKLFVMKKTGHLYSEDMEDVMRGALRWVVGR